MVYIHVPIWKYGQLVKYLLYFLTQARNCRFHTSQARTQLGLLQRLLSLLSKLTMNQPIQLSLEQQFNIRSFETQVQHMSLEQAQDFLVKLYKQMMMREATYKELLKHQWGLEPGAGA